MSEIPDDIMQMAGKIADDTLVIPRGRGGFVNFIAQAILFERQRHAEVMEEVRKVLEPFATAGKIIDGPFGPALFAEDDMAFKSGCAWSENGVSRTITWGDFRAARAILSRLEER